MMRRLSVLSVAVLAAGAALAPGRALAVPQDGGKPPPAEPEHPPETPGAKPPEKAPPSSETVDLITTGMVEPGLGNEDRVRANEAIALIQARRIAEAEAIADDVIARFERRMTDAATTYVVVANDAQVEVFRKEAGLAADARVVRLDWAFRIALHAKAFLASARKDDAEALRWLEKEQARAPYSAEVRCERGFILNRRGDPTKALAEYDDATRLARTFESEKPFLAPALRGRGFSLIELDRLADARAAFEESLRLEPGNRVATSELDYITKREAERRGPK